MQFGNKLNEFNGQLNGHCSALLRPGRNWSRIGIGSELVGIGIDQNRSESNRSESKLESVGIGRSESAKICRNLLVGIGRKLVGIVQNWSSELIRIGRSWSELVGRNSL